MRDARRPTRRNRGLRWALALLAMLGVAAAGWPGTALGAEVVWELSRSPAGFVAGSTATIRLVVGPGPSNDDDVGCVTVTIPAAFQVGAVAILGAPAGSDWSVAASGTTIVVAQAAGGGDRLEGATGQSLTIGVTVTGTAVGNYTWTADADRSQDCADGTDIPKSFVVSITPPPATPPPTPAPTPTPTPAPTPTPTPAPTPTPTPAPTPPPGATPTPTPPPTPTPTPPPGATPTPTPRPTPTPPPGTTPAPTPAPTPTGAAPTATPSPSAGPSENGSPSPQISPSPSASSSGSPAPTPVAGGPIDPTSPPGREFTIPAVGLGAPPIQGNLSADLAVRFAGALDWAVPGLVLSVPGLLLLLAVLAQSLGALAWLPIVRRRIGAFGPERRRGSGASGLSSRPRR